MGLTLDDHMRTANQIKVIPRQEGPNDRLPKAITNSPLIIFPIERCITRITPQEVIEESIVGDVCRSCDAADVVHGGEGGGETAVDAEDLGGDDGGDGEAVEYVDERLPDLDVAPSLALVVESIHYHHQLYQYVLGHPAESGWTDLG